ncbi:RDD family protein [Luteibacter sp.]|uniref:RDD family protein n=1 Tax=Luteibacter sp. TaxID=1886636 RepID=UPI002F3EA5A5
MDGNWLERQKASRGKRFGGALLDSAVLFVVIVPILLMVTATGTTSGEDTALIVTILAVIALVIVNLVMMHRSGQSIGKKMMGTKIVRTDGSRASLRRIVFLRIMPMHFLCGIPYLGGPIALANFIVIFGKDIRCLHDQIADTIVVESPG